MSVEAISSAAPREKEKCLLWFVQVQVVGDGGRVRSKGVVLESGEAVEADAVVCNADLPYAERELLPETVSRSFEVGPG